MGIWNYGPCIVCNGVGRKDKKKCQTCEGFGYWEHVKEETEAALQYLKNPEVSVSDYAKALCERRQKWTKADFDKFVECYPFITNLETLAEFDDLHSQGARVWSWAWVYTNRFVIEQYKSFGGDPTKHALGLSHLAWNWLEDEHNRKTSLNSKSDFSS